MAGPPRLLQRTLPVVLSLLVASGLVVATVSRTGDNALDAASSGAPARFVPAVASPAPPTPTPTDGPRRGLAAAAVAAAESAADATGFGSSTSPGTATAILDRATMEMAIGTGGEELVPSASLSKLVVAADILDRRSTEGLPVADADLRLIQRSLGPSDDGAMSDLWGRFDGVGAVGRLTVRADVRGIAPPQDPSQWGEMLVSAVGMVQVLQHVLTGMAPGDRDLIVGAMAAAPARATDGFDQAFGLLRSGLPVEAGGAKQGWMCCIGRNYHLHSVGVVGSDDRFVVAVLTATPVARGWDGARTRIDAMADAAANALQ